MCQSLVGAGWREPGREFRMRRCRVTFIHLALTVSLHGFIDYSYFSLWLNYLTKSSFGVLKPCYLPYTWCSKSFQEAPIRSHEKYNGEPRGINLVKTNVNPKRGKTLLFCSYAPWMFFWKQIKQAKGNLVMASEIQLIKNSVERQSFHIWDFSYEMQNANYFSKARHQVNFATNKNVL